MQTEANPTTSEDPHSMAPNETMQEIVPYPDFTQIPAVRYVFVAAYLIVMVLAVIGNAMVCCTVFTNRKMHTAVNYYIVNLAVCDFMVGIFVLPVKLMELTSPADWGILNDELCTTFMYLQTIFVFASVLTLVAICIERYMAVLHPLESRMHQTKARAKRILCMVWIIPCFVAAPFLYRAAAYSNTLQSSYGEISRLTCFTNLPDSVRKGYYTFLFVFIYILPLTFIAGTCLQVARCLLKDIPVHRQGSIRRQEANRRKVAKMVLMVVLAFVISWTPYFLVSIITQYQAQNFMEHHNFFFTMLCINLFAFINSCVNPFIYAAMSTRFRNGFRRCFRFIFMWALCNAGAEEENSAALNPANPERNAKRVRFRCQAHMSCLLTQSSSDGGSNANSEASMRTACTVDANGRPISSIMRAFTKKRSSQKIIAQYIKKTGAISLANANNLQVSIQNNKYDPLYPRNSSLLSQLSPAKPKLDRKHSSSLGDVSKLNQSTSEISSIQPKRCFSCLTISSDGR
ncbi:QRFP-like peptide receptor [Argiope bruennichi]|uniref:QRFP-like peptide receptor n=1 Tax=Argiope bruennichi TaxID=94029 RepID=UPI0024944876|nr:QRFP-like peptide receptor [Argiope bruennichi]